MLSIFEFITKKIKASGICSRELLLGAKCEPGPTRVPYRMDDIWIENTFSLYYRPMYLTMMVKYVGIIHMHLPS